MSDPYDEFAAVLKKFFAQRDGAFEGMARYAAVEGYSALSRESQDMGNLMSEGLWHVDRLLSGGRRVIGRIETWLEDGRLNVKLVWLGEDPNSEEDEARRFDDT